VTRLGPDRVHGAGTHPRKLPARGQDRQCNHFRWSPSTRAVTVSAKTGALSTLLGADANWAFATALKYLPLEFTVIV
jgi:hypothetical protein